MNARFLTVAAASIGWIVGFTATSVFRIARLWYLPVQREWVYSTFVTGLAMDLYGRVLIALVVGLAAGLVAFFVGRRTVLKPENIRLWTGWTFVSLALAAALFVVTKYG